MTSGRRAPLNGLALLIQQRMKELPGSRPGRHMTAADLRRATGLPSATVYAYVNGTIRATRISEDVQEKLKLIAKALDLPVQMLLTVAEEGSPAEVDEEAELLRLFRSLKTDVERKRVLFVVREIVAIGRRARP